jgi:hypothetical protein
MHDVGERAGHSHVVGPMIVAAVLGFLLVACGSGTAAPGLTVSADETQHDFVKVLITRATVLGDLDTVETAVDAISKADEAVMSGNADTASGLIKAAGKQVTLAAPIAARARSDVVSYLNALNAFDENSQRPKAGLDTDQRARIATMCTHGRAEAVAIRTTAAAYSGEWTAYSGLASALGTWNDRDTHGDYASPAAAIAAYNLLVDSLRSDLAAGKKAVADAEVPRLKATTDTATSIVDVRAEISVLATVQPPSPSSSS